MPVIVTVSRCIAERTSRAQADLSLYRPTSPSRHRSSRFCGCSQLSVVVELLLILPSFAAPSTPSQRVLESLPSVFNYPCSRISRMQPSSFHRLLRECSEWQVRSLGLSELEDAERRRLCPSLLDPLFARNGCHNYSKPTGDCPRAPAVSVLSRLHSSSYSVRAPTRLLLPPLDELTQSHPQIQIQAFPRACTQDHRSVLHRWP